MDDYRKDEIIYDEDWLTVDTPVLAQTVENDDSENDDFAELPNKQKEKRKRRFPALITIQLVLCLIAAFSVFMLKAMDTDVYKKLCDWYYEQMRNTLVSNSTFEDIDLSEYVKSTIDQVKATTDEI